MVGEHDVEHRARQLGRKAVDPLDRAAHDVVAERDLAQELALVGEVDRHRVGLVGLDLPDVVDQRAGHSQVAVDSREGARHRADGLAHGQRVLEQPVQVGLVVVLRGRRAPETLSTPAELVADQGVEQLPQPRVAHRGDQAAQVGLHLLGAGGRSVHQVGEPVVAGLRERRRLQHELGPVALRTPRSGRAPAARCRAARSRAPRRRRPRRWPPACPCSRTASGAGSPRRCAAARRALSFTRRIVSTVSPSGRSRTNSALGDGRSPASKSRVSVDVAHEGRSP